MLTWSNNGRENEILRGFFSRIAKISSSHSRISFFFFYSVDMMWFDFFFFMENKSELNKM